MLLGTSVTGLAASFGARRYVRMWRSVTAPGDGTGPRSYSRFRSRVLMSVRSQRSIVLDVFHSDLSDHKVVCGANGSGAM